MGCPPQTIHINITLEDKIELENLKSHPDEPLYMTFKKILEERDNSPGRERVHKRLTSTFTGFDIVLQELYDKGIVLDCINRLDDHMQSAIRSFLKENNKASVVH